MKAVKTELSSSPQASIKTEIIAKLNNIFSVEASIEQRMWQKSSPVTAADGTVLTEETISRKINSLANDLISDLPYANPVLVSIMDGALPFASQLNHALQAHDYSFQYTSMQVSSYGNTMQSGTLQISALPKILLGGRTVIVVDEVCDTGKTYQAIRDLFLQQGAINVRLMVLVDKVQPRPLLSNPSYCGFEVSKDTFIIGMGLDYSGLLRNKLSIRAVDLSTLPTVPEQALLNLKKSLNEQLIDCINQHRITPVSAERHTLFSMPKVTSLPESPDDLSLAKQDRQTF